MHDLNTIRRLNLDTFGQAIKNFQRQGRFVMAVYAGLHIVSIESFSTADEAADGVAERTERLEASERIEVFPPARAAEQAAAAAPVETLMRDQSEDRTSGFATLEDYLRHVAPPGALIVTLQVADADAPR